MFHACGFVVGFPLGYRSHASPRAGAGLWGVTLPCCARVPGRLRQRRRRGRGRKIKKAVARRPSVTALTALWSQVLMIFFPAGRFLTIPLPPGPFAARFFAAVILPPLLIFAMVSPFGLLFAVLLCQPSWGRRGDDIAVQRDRANPGQRPAIQRGTGQQRDGLIGHDGSLENRGRPQGRGTAHLPIDVGRFGTAAQDYLATGGCDQGDAIWKMKTPFTSPFASSVRSPDDISSESVDL